MAFGSLKHRRRIARGGSIGGVTMRFINIFAAACAIAAVAWPVASFSDDLHQFDDQATFKSTGDFVHGCGGASAWSRG